MQQLTNRGLVISIALACVLSAVAACSKQQAADHAAASGTEITFKSDPATPKMGDNTFEVMVMQDGKSVDDAQVSVEFFMPAMPEMKMAEMRTKAELKPAGSGTYRGSGQVMMAGNWQVTVMAMRNGQEIARTQLTVAAK
jgi:uncharacterized GH25 family protein